MLQYAKISISEGIDTNRTSASKECMLCHYWCFKDVGFKFEPHVCNKCHDVLMTAYELKNIAILNVKGVDFRCIWGVLVGRRLLIDSIILFQKIKVSYKWILVQRKGKLVKMIENADSKFDDYSILRIGVMN